jgi:hypothetical protein
MEPGIFSLLFGPAIALVLLPFQLGRTLMRWGQLHAQRPRSRAQQETNLRRASHPVGVLAVLPVAFSFTVRASRPHTPRSRSIAGC